MKALACASCFAIVLLISLTTAVGFDDEGGGGGALKYTITGEDCKTQGGQDCTSCSTVLVSDPTCTSKIRCDSVDCPISAANYDACTAGNGNGANCGTNKGNTPLPAACGTCKIYAGMASNCMTGGTCTPIGCNGTGKNWTSPAALLCP